MEEQMLKQLVKSKNILKKKFQSIKMGEDETSTELQNTFKPLTEPLQKLVKLTNDNALNSFIAKTEHTTIPKKSFQESLITSTPNKRNIKREFLSKSLLKNGFDGDGGASTYEDELEPIEEEDAQDDTFYSQTDDEATNLSNLKKNKKLDAIFGPHKESNGEWKFANESLKINNEKIIIGNQHWAYTPGLFELLFYHNPKNYDKSELEIYKRILLNTNAHRVDFNPNKQIKSSRGNKYKKIIKKLFEDTHTGKGLMRVNPQKPDYIYWDDPNELVERLKLLIASQQAGNNNQTNEIVSIIEELREADIIE